MIDPVIVVPGEDRTLWIVEVERTIEVPPEWRKIEVPRDDFGK